MKYHRLLLKDEERKGPKKKKMNHLLLFLASLIYQLPPLPDKTTVRVWIIYMNMTYSFGVSNCCFVTCHEAFGDQQMLKFFRALGVYYRPANSLLIVTLLYHSP